MEVADRPCPLGLQQPQQVQEILRRIGGAVGQPPRHLVKFAEQSVSLSTVRSADLSRQSQSSQHAGHCAGVFSGRGRHQRHGCCGVALESGLIAEDGGGHRVKAACKKKGCWGVAVPGDGYRRAGCGGAFAAHRIDHPLVGLKYLSHVYAANASHKGQTRVELGDADVQ